MLDEVNKGGADGMMYENRAVSKGIIEFYENADNKDKLPAVEVSHLKVLGKHRGRKAAIALFVGMARHCVLNGEIPINE